MVLPEEIGEKEPSCVIFDEFVAMPICFLGIRNFVTPKIPTRKILLIGFVIFRLFDILKPLGIKKVQHLSGGIGIVIDDILAAIYTDVTTILICLTVIFKPMEPFLSNLISTLLGHYVAAKKRGFLCQNSP
jgi:phosphatidylglycerophosphatase A